MTDTRPAPRCVPAPEAIRNATRDAYSHYEGLGRNVAFESAADAAYTATLTAVCAAAGLPSNDDPVDAIRRLQRERDAAVEVARSNKRHNAVLTELVERVQAFADELAATHAKRLRGLLNAPTTAEHAVSVPESTPNPKEQP